MLAALDPADREAGIVVPGIGFVGPRSLHEPEKHAMSTPLILPKSLACSVVSYLRERQPLGGSFPDAALVDGVSFSPNFAGQGLAGVRAADDRLVVVEDDGEADAREIVAAVKWRAKRGNLAAIAWLEERGVVTLPAKLDGGAE